MALDTVDKLISALSSGLLVPIYKASISNTGAGQFTSLWRATGTPAQADIPSTAATCDDDLKGALTLLGDSASLAYYLVQAAIVGVVAGTYIIYDRLAHMGGLSGATTGDQTVNVTLTTAAGQGRCAADGSDVRWFAEMYADIGTTPQTCTVTYTNQSDATKTTTISIGGASPLNRASRIIQILPLSGDTIKSITKVSIGTTTGAAGSWGITARSQLAQIGQAIPNVQCNSDFAATGVPLVQDKACLEIVVLCTGSSTNIITGTVTVGIS